MWHISKLHMANGMYGNTTLREVASHDPKCWLQISCWGWVCLHYDVHSWQSSNSWWHHRMETFSALLALCARNSPVTGEFHAQRPVTRRFDVFFDPQQNERLSKHLWGWWFETPSHPLWRHCNVSVTMDDMPVQTSQTEETNHASKFALVYRYIYTLGQNDANISDFCWMPRRSWFASFLRSAHTHDFRFYITLSLAMASM